VHATTVYRRWGSVSELLADVATSRVSGDIVVPDTGWVSCPCAAPFEDNEEGAPA
jgi:hypothetical protein